MHERTIRNTDTQREIQMGHFVLVHGLGHGAWQWYKLTTLLEEAGHSVTALDMTGCGTNPKSIKDAKTFEDYAQPLLEFMESVDGKVILFGHSVGGNCLGLAMERFPEKVSVAVFASAFMPDTKNAPSFVIDKFIAETPAEAWLDTKFEQFGDEQIALAGPKYIQKIYTRSPKENVELAKRLLRPSSLFAVDLSRSKKYTNEAYGSVKRVYIIDKEDLIFSEKYQHWMVENSPVDEVIEIDGADHVPMFSLTQELFDSLIQIAHKYA